MSVDHEKINIFEFINNNSWDVNKILLLFGMNYDPIINNLGSIGNHDYNLWVWVPNIHCHRLTIAVYHHLNYNLTQSESWKCWKKLFKMNVAPRVKHFIWALIALAFCVALTKKVLIIYLLSTLKLNQFGDNSVSKSILL